MPLVKPRWLAPCLSILCGRWTQRERGSGAPCSSEGCEVWWYNVKGNIPHWSHLFCEGRGTRWEKQTIRAPRLQAVRWIPPEIRITCFVDYLGIWGNISCINLDITITGSNVRTVGKDSQGCPLAWNSNSFCILWVCKWNSIFPRLEIHLLPSLPSWTPCWVCPSILNTSICHSKDKPDWLSTYEWKGGMGPCAMLLSSFQRFSRKESFCVHQPGSTLSPRSYQFTLPHSRGQIFGRAGVWVELCKWIRPSPFLWRQESMGWMLSCKSWFCRLPTWSDFELQLCGPRCSATPSWVCLLTYTSVFLEFINAIS